MTIQMPCCFLIIHWRKGCLFKNYTVNLLLQSFMLVALKQIWRTLRQKILKRISVIKGNEFNISFDNVLIIAPHPDDEVLGCGGMIARLVSNGTKVYVLFLTDGATSHVGCCAALESEVSNQRRNLAVQANAILKIPKENLSFFNGSDGILPRNGQADFNEMAQNLASFIKEKDPDAIFCPHPFEGWTDHIAASELTEAAMVKVSEGKRTRLYYYCVWFWYSLPLKKALSIDWRKARLLNISKQLPLKRKAVNTYITAFAPCGNSWVGNLPEEFLRSFDWQKELFFEVYLHGLSK